MLGAGASREHGAPLTNEILEWALTKADRTDTARLDVVRDFLRDVFAFDARDPNVAWEACPALPETLSMVDMALDRGETLAENYNTKKLRSVRENLEYAIFKALDFALSRRNPDRKSTDATARLVQHLDPQDSTVISFNYDILIDLQLAKGADQSDGYSLDDFEEIQELPVDYGVEFQNMRPPDGDQFRLLKLHGSFNWFWDPNNGDLIYGGLTKAISRLFSPHGLDDIYQHATDWQAILVTPTHLKDLRNYHLAQLWRKAEQHLREAEEVTFIGYSMPGDDIHIKYLFKRAFGTRAANLARCPEIVVVDWVPPEQRGDVGKSVVQENYERLFGSEQVDYYNEGFAEYVRQHLPKQ